MPTGVPHFPKCPKFNHSTYPSHHVLGTDREDYYRRAYARELDTHKVKRTGREISRGEYRTPKRELTCSCGHTWWSINPNWRSA